ncbi:MAG: dihydrofolate reductase [Deltaproteobacteria bacterium]|nr:dihydrofolate reductase [Deltaproteobacteria bacterium]
MMPFDVVAAVDEDLGIGRQGQLPWKLAADTAHFKRLTTETAAAGRTNAVIMGRKTWESIPARFRPLRGRINAVATRQSGLRLPEGVLCAVGLEHALALCAAPPLGGRIETAFVIGGAELYAQAISLPECRRLYLTRVAGRFDCDAFFPEFEERFRLVARSEPREERGLRYVFETHERI